MAYSCRCLPAGGPPSPENTRTLKARTGCLVSRVPAAPARPPTRPPATRPPAEPIPHRPLLEPGQAQAEAGDQGAGGGAAQDAGEDAGCGSSGGFSQGYGAAPSLREELELLDFGRPAGAGRGLQAGPRGWALGHYSWAQGHAWRFSSLVSICATARWHAGALGAGRPPAVSYCAALHLERARSCLLLPQTKYGVDGEQHPQKKR